MAENLIDVEGGKNLAFINLCYSIAQKERKQFEVVKDQFGENHKRTLEANSKRLKGCTLEGASRCFMKGTKVKTGQGVKPIEEIKKGDWVKSFNFEKNDWEYRKVRQSHKFTNNKKRLIKINLKNGQSITATEDHEFFFKGGWVELKHLVSLLNGNMEKGSRL